jgi:hypothetical protein
MMTGMAMTVTKNQDFFERDGIVFKAVVSDNCLGCALFQDASCSDGPACLSLYRGDGRNIIWVMEPGIGREGLLCSENQWGVL